MKQSLWMAWSECVESLVGEAFQDTDLNDMTVHDLYDCFIAGMTASEVAEKFYTTYEEVE